MAPCVTQRNVGHLVEMEHETMQILGGGKKINLNVVKNESV